MFPDYDFHTITFYDASGMRCGTVGVGGEPSSSELDDLIHDHPFAVSARVEREAR
jgi:hypothetical protein